MAAIIKRRAGPISAAWRSILKQPTPTGVYTPTLTGVTNIAASTSYQGMYTRTANLVTVYGRADIDPTALTQSTIRISLPVASDFSVILDCAGVAGWGGIASQVGSIQADTTNNEAVLDFVAVSVANAGCWFSFMYEIK